MTQGTKPPGWTIRNPWLIRLVLRTLGYGFALQHDIDHVRFDGTVIHVHLKAKFEDVVIKGTVTV